ncbi:hypothetical protein W97_04510 [Coniosporium apollinis CBS 100218]|uniref:GDS1 winged helix domain-containing protein n=1 Tax=Coniosporium apollinis (strain CBS 100218) TaxID=1168221 RepID=R7YTM0_CONA1|nr:uncharacterized protein W97_04510 [Coniosporium apollinis CBS 100218]EON65272.1 hypothetical protein W97_04510 [Coniosporium apollinis CBS 100218]
MPYNTRRKSLSLPMLGIQLPNSSRSSSHRSPPASNSATPHEQAPPTKKVKRSHSPSISASPASPPPKREVRFHDEQPKSAGRVAEQTPPPSPGRDSDVYKVDTDGINDDIVVGVIQQLEKTGNRPHLLKELAAVLANGLPIVESSANPSAIISSRLASYLKRPWTALSPCPVGKELVGTHPKRIYFFLTTSPHQSIPDAPDAVSAVAMNRIISPSLSSAADDEEERAARTRESMSPEVDLSSPELGDTDAHLEASLDSLSGRSSSHPPTTTNIAHNRRAASPPLEREEREFTQTASSLQQRSRSQSQATMMDAPLTEELPSGVDVQMHDALPGASDETEESARIKNSEAMMALFGEGIVPPGMKLITLSSPLLKPQLTVETMISLEEDLGDLYDPAQIRMGYESPARDDEFNLSAYYEEMGWLKEMRSPEAVDVEEMESLFLEKEWRL